MDKYQNKFRIPSARWQNWNYAAMGAYFITICTKNRKPFFGEIVQGKMQLNDIGLLAEFEWLQIVILRPDMKLELGAFVVMPNHLHGIIIIGENEFNTQKNKQCGDENNNNGDEGGGAACRDAMPGVSKSTNVLQQNNIPTTTHTISQTTNKFGPQSKNLASIIRGFKSAVTSAATNVMHIEFGWQSRFHDHVIRDAKSFERIQNYIANNPMNWEVDKFHLNR